MQKKEFVELACGRQDICKMHLSVLGFCLGRDGYKLGSQVSAFQALLEGLQGAAHVGPPSINPSIQHCGYLISLFTFTVYFFCGGEIFLIHVLRDIYSSSLLYLIHFLQFKF